jgi:hypothetical protein
MSAHDFYSGRAVVPQRKADEDEADMGVVSDYLSRLESVLFDQDETLFPAVFEEMASDPSVGRLEAIEIATQFMSPTSRSASRSHALDKVYERWETLMQSRHRTRAGPAA